MVEKLIYEYYAHMSHEKHNWFLEFRMIYRDTFRLHGFGTYLRYAVWIKLLLRYLWDTKRSFAKLSISYT